MSDAQLRALIPNIITAVKGETPFFDRLAPFIELAEDWVRNTFTSEQTFNTIAGYSESNSTKLLTARLVVADALRRAIPSLDIVLTPNGFGVVSTTTIAAASKPRVDRLVGSMLTHRDECIAALLPALVSASQWTSSKQSEFFGATLFPNLDIVDAVGGATGSKWDKYLELRPQVIDLENSLAEEWFSPELMKVLRNRNLLLTLSATDRYVVGAIQAQIISFIKNGSFNARRLADIVTFIRNRPDDFPEWHNSATAELFAPPTFRNNKNAAGYFF